MLQQYVKATNHLQPHLSTKEKSSVRTSLIACVLFVATELFRGRFQSAQIHLANGLQIMREMKVHSGNNDEAAFQPKPWIELTDGWIWDAFSRLQLQVSLFKQTHEYPRFIFRELPLECQVQMFRTRNDAWQALQSLFNQIFSLSVEYRRQKAIESYLDEDSSLILRRKGTQTELVNWLKVLKRSRERIQEQDPEGFLYQLLRMYHGMAKIMTATSLLPGDETAFDRETESFIALMEQATEIWKLKSCIPRVVSWPKHLFNMSGSVIDMGWIPPLYYTALKCRVHRIRVHAIRLLETRPHREGIWDTRITAAITQKVMAIEERDFFKGFEISDDFPLTCSPDLGCSTLPALPNFYRVHEIKLDLPNGPKDRVALSWKQRTESDGWEGYMEEYDLNLQAWVKKKSLISRFDPNVMYCEDAAAMNIFP